MAKTALVYGFDGNENAEKTVAELIEFGVNIVSASDEKAALDEADFLVLVSSNADELNEKNATEKWSYFLDEIKWKRKQSGEVLIIDTSEISFSPSRLPYALKKCKRYRLTHIKDVADYINDKAAPPAPEPPKTTYMPAPPKKEYVAPKENGACKDDHVFEKNTPAKNPYKTNSYKTYVRDEKKEGACKDDHVFEKEEKKPEPKKPSWSIDDYDNNTDAEKEDDFDLWAGEKTKRDKGEPFSEYPDLPRETPRKVKSPFGIIILVIFAIIFFSVFARMCSAIVEFGFHVGLTQIIELSVNQIKTVIQWFMH